MLTHLHTAIPLHPPIYATMQHDLWNHELSCILNLTSFWQLQTSRGYNVSNLMQPLLPHVWCPACKHSPVEIHIFCYCPWLHIPAASITTVRLSCRVFNLSHTLYSLCEFIIVPLPYVALTALDDPCHHNIYPLALGQTGHCMVPSPPTGFAGACNSRHSPAPPRSPTQVQPHEATGSENVDGCILHCLPRVPPRRRIHHPNRGNIQPQCPHCSWRHTGHPTHLRLKLKQSKTDQIGRGKIVLLPRTGDASCPYNAMSQYWKDVTATSRARTPFFRFADGCPLSSVECRHHLRRLLCQAGYQASLYNTHSFCIGAATSAATAGTTPDK